MALKKTLPATLSRRDVEDDKLDLLPRMYQQVDKLISALEALDVIDKENVTVPQRIQALVATGRIMKMVQDLRKGTVDASAGSAVNRYAAAFQTPHDPSRGTSGPRPANLVQFDRTDPDTDPYADTDD